MTTFTQPKPRRVPPPCWTQDETQALILAYRDRWHALRRTNLKAADWDDVAATMATHCPLPSSSSPPKTALQCRHKMEKLRKRYRSEKQRASAYPGRFFSSWALFHLMEELEKSVSVFGSEPDRKIHKGVEFGCGFSVDKKFRKVDRNSSPNIDFDGNSGSEFGEETEDDQNSMPQGFKYNSKNGKTSSFYSEVADYVVQRVDGASGFPLKTLGGRHLMPSGFTRKGNGQVDVKVKHNFKLDREFGVDIEGGFNAKFGGGSSGFTRKSNGQVDVNLNHNFKQDREFGVDIEGGFNAKFRGDRDFVPAGFRPMNCGIVDGNLNSGVDFKKLDGYSSLSRSKFVNKKNVVVGVKRGVDPVEELASSITLLGEGFVRMEQMKMKMTMQIEKMRMEMEMKRNEVFIESQQQILDAFVNALLEKKKKKKMKLVSPDS